MADIFELLIPIILFLAVLLVIPTLMTRWAVRQVIRRFRGLGAMSADSARTIDELGLRPPTFMQRLTRVRDYKPHALDFLKKNEVVRETDDGKLYLSEKKLRETRIAGS